VKKCFILLQCCGQQDFVNAGSCKNL